MLTQILSLGSKSSFQDVKYLHQLQTNVLIIMVFLSLHGDTVGKTFGSYLCDRDAASPRRSEECDNLAASADAFIFIYFTANLKKKRNNRHCGLHCFKLLFLNIQPVGFLMVVLTDRPWINQHYTGNTGRLLACRLLSERTELCQELQVPV